MPQERTLSLESRQVLIGGSPTHYLVGGQGPEVVLLHGGGGDCRQWGPSLPALAENYRVYAPDLPGFGQSPNPRDDWSVINFVRFVEDFVQALGLEAVRVVGHSLGGGVALGFAIHFPQRLERLVLVNSLGLSRGIAFWTRLLSGALGMKWGQRTVAEALRWKQRRRGLGQDLGASVAERQLYLVQHILGLRGQRLTFSPRLAEVRVPTLIVWGDRDPYLPVAQARRAHQLIPGSRLEVFPRCGHAPFRERPGEFHRLLRDFLG